jgi:hypothetical protein
MPSNIVQEVGQSGFEEEEGLAAEIARVEAVLAERRYELTSNRAAVRAVGRTLVRAARALLGEEPPAATDDARRPRGRSRR